MLRWIAAARPDSISCSQTAHASASKGSGRRRGRSHGLRRITGPISGSQRKRRWNSLRSWSTPSAKRMRSMPAAAASAERASALIRTADPAAHARTTTCSSPAQSALVRAPSRATMTPSRPGPGSWYGPAGTTSCSIAVAIGP